MQAQLASEQDIPNESEQQAVRDLVSAVKKRVKRPQTSKTTPVAQKQVERKGSSLLEVAQQQGAYDGVLSKNPVEAREKGVFSPMLERVQIKKTNPQYFEALSKAFN